MGPFFLEIFKNKKKKKKKLRAPGVFFFFYYTFENSANKRDQHNKLTEMHRNTQTFTGELFDQVLSVTYLESNLFRFMKFVTHKSTTILLSPLEQYRSSQPLEGDDLVKKPQLKPELWCLLLWLFPSSSPLGF